MNEDKDIGGFASDDKPETGGEGQDTSGEGQSAESNENTRSITGGEAPSEGEDKIGNISERLAKEESGAKEEDPNATKMEQGIPFDIDKLSRDQIQSLKEILAATPDRVRRKKENPTVNLRRIEGQLVEDFKNAFITLVDDPEHNRKVERHVIPTKFFGEEEYKPILYSTFINSDRVPCEVVSQRTTKDEYIEGETTSRETGKTVEMINTKVRYWYTVKLPEGEKVNGNDTVEIEGKVANA